MDFKSAYDNKNRIYIILQNHSEKYMHKVNHLL